MIDFHSHFLPEMDDGAKNLSESLKLLRESKKQGVELMVATPHFYPDYDNIGSFLERRKDAVKKVRREVRQKPEKYPEILTGAEILYFPGMSGYPELRELCIQGSDCIMVEMPMEPWTEEMLDEVEMFRRRFGCTPVIAHLDRYIRFLEDPGLIDRVRERKLWVQVNASFFIHEHLRDLALDLLENGEIHLVGSDCHNTKKRPQTLGLARECAAGYGLEDQFEGLSTNAAYLLNI